MKTNILLILGHPSEDSFCNALLDAYRKGAEHSGADCKVLYLSRLDFNLNFNGYKADANTPLEKELIVAQQLILWADHIVLAYPNWWGFMPALAKGFIDRVLLPGFAFQYQSGKLFPEKLLVGKSIRLLVTMDTPKLWFYLMYRASQYQILKDIVFGFVGFDPVKFSTFGFIRKSTDNIRSKWLQKVEQLGRQFK